MTVRRWSRLTVLRWSRRAGGRFHPVAGPARPLVLVAVLALGVDGSPWEHLTALVPAVRVPTVAGPCHEWAATAEAVGWPRSEWPTVARVMRCESGCDPHAHNPSGASGLMQVMPFWWQGRDPYDPAVNLTMALEVHDRQGWRAWTCYR